MPKGNISTSCDKKTKNGSIVQLNRSSEQAAGSPAAAPRLPLHAKSARSCPEHEISALLGKLESCGSDLSDIEDVSDYSSDEVSSDDSSDDGYYQTKSFRRKKHGFIGPRALSSSQAAARKVAKSKQSLVRPIDYAELPAKTTIITPSLPATLHILDKNPVKWGIQSFYSNSYTHDATAHTVIYLLNSVHP